MIDMKRMKNCLLIDDDIDDQEIFEICVQELNPDIKFLAVKNGIEAVSLLKSNDSYTPDYIFIDVNMPKLNGLDCLKILRANERLHACKIYMYSTTSAHSSLEESKKLGADDFIIKPTKTAELKEILSKIFKIDLI
ncbi:MAG: response regulator [Cytophagaceae bacterium]|jgi:CheY-like chemotaxis protein|nr:response regulator [Cytophagaceae bacterium]